MATKPPTSNLLASSRPWIYEHIAKKCPKNSQKSRENDELYHEKYGTYSNWRPASSGPFLGKDICRSSRQPKTQKFFRNTLRKIPWKIPWKSHEIDVSLTLSLVGFLTAATGGWSHHFFKVGTQLCLCVGFGIFHSINYQLQYLPKINQNKINKLQTNLASRNQHKSDIYIYMYIYICL